MVNPYHWFHRKLMNNRWIREDENNWQAPPSNRDMISGGSGFIVIIAVFAFVCLNNVIYIGFSKNPTVFVVSIFLLVCCFLLTCVLLFTLNTNIKKKQNRRQHKKFGR